MGLGKATYSQAKLPTVRHAPNNRILCTQQPHTCTQHFAMREGSAQSRFISVITLPGEFMSAVAALMEKWRGAAQLGKPTGVRAFHPGLSARPEPTNPPNLCPETPTLSVTRPETEKAGQCYCVYGPGRRTDPRDKKASREEEGKEPEETPRNPRTRQTPKTREAADSAQQV